MVMCECTLGIQRGGGGEREKERERDGNREEVKLNKGQKWIELNEEHIV